MLLKIHGPEILIGIDENTKMHSNIFYYDWYRSILESSKLIMLPVIMQ